MKSSDILLTLCSEYLKVWKVHDHICVDYEDAWISDGITLQGAFGIGPDFESACDDYLNKIRGKKLIFDGPNHAQRKEVTVLG